MKARVKPLHPGQTNARGKRCGVSILVGRLPQPCGDKHVRAGRCAEHYADWKNAKESRRGTEAHNPLRDPKRFLKSLGLSGRQCVRHRKARRREAA